MRLAHGADVNANWKGDFPILFAPCESVDVLALGWLLDHGADPNRPKPGTQGTALDYLIGSYLRSSQLPACIDRLSSAGGKTKYDLPGVLDVLCDRVERLASDLSAEPDLLMGRISGLDCGSTAARRLTLSGGTLLHVAAEYGRIEAAKLLLTRGASSDVRALCSEAGIGGQTPLFHAVTQFANRGLATTRLLLDSGADVNIRAKLPGHYERPEEYVECTPLGYALRFPGPDFPGSNDETIALLRERGAVE